VRVSVVGTGRSFDVARGRTLLDAALDAGLNLPHSCKGGNCGACRARLVAGDIVYPNGRPLGLSDAEVAEGLILLCQAHAQGDVSVETFELRPAEEIEIKRLPCRVERAERWSHDVMGVFLRLPAAEDFEFRPGQYLDIMLSKGRRRSFSIASPPHDARLIELHVRRVAGGEFTDRLFAGEARGTLLTLEGPLGHFVYRDADPAQAAAAAPASAPMLLIGGGTGLAPLKSILRHVVETGRSRDMTLYWGVRSERDLYAHSTLQELAARNGRMRYVPVLSDAEPAWAGRRGLVHEAVLEDLASLEGFEVYASGPPAMIDAIRRDFPARGMNPARLSFDSFDYAPDSPARQRTRAATSS
jgi:CDP-4-dehydro-6-deoxyglucose reductase, E3